MPELPWSCPYCADEPRGHGDRTVSTGFDEGWRAAMKFAHHCHTRKDGALDANGVVGAGPDSIIVDEDWLDVQIRRMKEAENALAGMTEERNEERRLRIEAESEMARIEVAARQSGRAASACRLCGDGRAHERHAKKQVQYADGSWAREYTFEPVYDEEKRDA